MLFERKKMKAKKCLDVLTLFLTLLIPIKAAGKHCQSANPLAEINYSALSNRCWSEFDPSVVAVESDGKETIYVYTQLNEDPILLEQAVSKDCATFLTKQILNIGRRRECSSIFEQGPASNMFLRIASEESDEFWIETTDLYDAF